MAVYTPLTADDIAAFLAGGQSGALLAFSPISAGVENTNYHVITSLGRFVLTLYEKRVKTSDLPFFLGLMRHLAAKKLAVPEPVIEGQIKDKAAALCRFLPGLSIEGAEASPALARLLGSSLAQLHEAARDLQMVRQDDLCLPAGWRKLADCCVGRADRIRPGLARLISLEAAELEKSWPERLPAGTIHADLFPDNVLWDMEAVPPRVGGIIDFYFAATGFWAYDLAVTLNAWAFDAQNCWRADWAAAFLAGYEDVRRLSPEERAALPLLLRGSALRFLLTRLYDLLFPASGALVTPKDPLVFARRLCHHAGIDFQPDAAAR